MILIGYWEEQGKNNYINPNLLMFNHWMPEERHRMVKYLKGGKFLEGYMGHSTCRICGQHNGSTELHDGAFYWPQGLAHYVEAHGVVLPERFVNHMRASDYSAKAKLEPPAVDDDYWDNWCAEVKDILLGG